MAASQGPAASDAEGASSDVNLEPASKKGLAHPGWPGLGEVGKKVIIGAKHFLVNNDDVISLNPSNYIFGAFNLPCDISVTFSDPRTRKQVSVKKDSGKTTMVLVLQSLEAISGEVSIAPIPGERIEHTGNKIELLGRIDIPGEIYERKMFPFELSTVEMPYESYNGTNFRLRYILNVTTGGNYVGGIVEYRGFCGRNYSPVPTINNSIKPCTALKEGYVPPVTFVVVHKRIRMMLSPEVHGRCDMTDKSGNILPGTVDQKICHPTESAFYLCSHAGIQGTCQPTHYHVLYDENSFTADTLQSMTNNFCYIYAQCLQEVSLVLPAFAAVCALCMDNEGTRKRRSEEIGGRRKRARGELERPQHIGSSSTLGNSGQAAEDYITKDSSSQMIPVRGEGTRKRGGEMIGGIGKRTRQDLERPQYTRSDSTLGTSGLAADVREGPEDYITKDTSSQLIPVKIRFYGECRYLEVKKGTQLEVVVDLALAKYGLRSDDCFFMLEGGMKVLRKDIPVEDKLTVDVHVRLKGGVQISEDQLFSIHDWIKSLKHPDDWFEKIWIPRQLRRKGSLKRFVIALRPTSAQLVLIKVLEFLERMHKQGQSFGGSISLRDLVFIPSLGVVTINPSCIIDWQPLTQARYKKDCLIIVELIETYLKYQDEGTKLPAYPMYIEQLKWAIENLKDEGLEYMSEKERSLIFNHPAVLSIPQQIGMITNLMIKYHKGFHGSKKDKSKFEKLLSNNSSALRRAGNWKELVSDQKAPPEMARVYKSGPGGRRGKIKEFKDGFLGRLDYSRCFLTHAEKASDFEMLAALYVLWETQLIELQNMLVVVFDDWIPSSSPQALPSLPQRPPMPAEVDDVSGYIWSDSLAYKDSIHFSEIWNH